MPTLADIANDVGLGTPPVSARAVFQRLRARSLRAAIASNEIEQFHTGNLGILTVGSPKGLLTENPNGSYQQDYTFGRILRPLDAPITIPVRWLVTIEVAGIRIFGTDDPSGEDEPYVVASVFAIDKVEQDRSVITTRIGPDDIGPVQENRIFGQGRQLVDKAIFIPGDGEIRLRVSIMDKEQGDPQKIQDDWSAAAQSAMAVALAAIPVVGPPALILAKASGALSDLGDTLGGVVSAVIGDDLIDFVDFVIDNEFLAEFSGDRSATLNRHSESIPGIVYNFPQLSEAGPEASTWLFDRGAGKGTYRAFFRVSAVPVTFP